MTSRDVREIIDDLLVRWIALSAHLADESISPNGERCCYAASEPVHLPDHHRVELEDPIDMTSPQGRAFAVMLAVFGEMEAEAIRARVGAARAHLLKVGRFVGGGIPYGYESAPNPAGPGRVLVKDPDRIGWLEGVVRMALAGDTVNAITRWLTDQGAPEYAQRHRDANRRYEAANRASVNRTKAAWKRANRRAKRGETHP